MKNLQICFFTLFVLFLSINAHADDLVFISKQDAVMAGDKIKITIQIPTSEMRYPAFIKIWDNPRLEGRELKQIFFTDELMRAGLLTPFTVQIDTFNWPAGDYYFQIAGLDEAPVVSIRIEEKEFPEIGEDFYQIGLFDAKTGKYLADVSADSPMPVLKPDRTYMLALDLRDFSSVNSTVWINFANDQGGSSLYFMRINMIPSPHFNGSLLNMTDACQNENPDGIRYQSEEMILKQFFKTPKHAKYHEHDGGLEFTVSGATQEYASCTHSHWNFQTQYNDTSAHPGLPTFSEFNQRFFPNEPERNEEPADEFDISIVRLGSALLDTEESLNDFARDIENRFSVATKGYFKINVTGVHNFPLVNDHNRQWISDWYGELPKTPGKPILDLNNAHELYLAGLLYYYVQFEANGEMNSLNFATQLYEPRSNGEDLTIYLADGNSRFGGQAMGTDGAWAQVVKLLPNLKTVFFIGDGDQRTYHFDLQEFNRNQNTNYTAQEFIRNEIARVSTTSIMGTFIHEMGHTLWLEKTAINLRYGHGSEITPGFGNKIIEDNSLQYFSRSSVMSYGRDITDSNSIVYDDADLEKLLEAYSYPQIKLSRSSRPLRKNTLSVLPGETLTLDFSIQSGVGISSFHYQNLYSPVDLDPNSPENAGIFLYERYLENGSPRLLENPRLELTLSESGKYTYVFYAETHDEFASWFEVTSDPFYLTIIVAKNKDDEPIPAKGYYGY